MSEQPPQTGEKKEGEQKGENIPDEVKQFVSTALVDLQAQIQATNNTLVKLAEAVVKMDQKITAGGGAGAGRSTGSPVIDVILELLKGGTASPDSLEAAGKTVDGLVKFSESMDRFRKPSPIGPAEALLMRAGFERLRNPLPRYMTKSELKRYEALLGIELGEEGEGTEHIK